MSLFAPLRERNFRLLWLGETISLAGDHFYFVALPFLILELTGSDLAVGTVLMTAAFPRAILMLVGGAMTDRYTPRGVMLASNVCRGLLVALLATLVVTEAVAVWHLYAVALAFGTADAFFFPAFTAIVPRVVGDTEKLAPANGLLQTSANATTLIGPAAGGVVVASLGTAAALGFDVTTFAFSALMLWLIRLVPAAGTAGSAPGAERPRVGAAIREGLAYVWRDRGLRALIVAAALIGFASQGPLVVGLTTLADERFAGPTSFGAMISAAGAGAVAGSLGGGAIGARLNRRLALVVVWSVTGLVIAGLGFAESVAQAAVLAGVMGAGGAVVNVMLVTWLQSRTEPSLLGRVMSVVMFAAVGLTPLSYAVAGFVAEAHVTAMFVGSGTLVVVVAGAAAASGALRRL
ncbi:MAG: MFS transporter [Acidobacteria bacterium]|nr:MFS transporter [Acidobacteriota bacterium]